MKRYTSDLIRLLSAKHGRSPEHYRGALRELTAAIAEELSRGHSVQLTDFGTFYSLLQPAARIRDIRTGKAMIVPAHRRAAFRPGERLKRAVRAEAPTKPNGIRKPRIGRLLGLGKRSRA